MRGLQVSWWNLNIFQKRWFHFWFSVFLPSSYQPELNAVSQYEQAKITNKHTMFIKTVKSIWFFCLYLKCPAPFTLVILHLADPTQNVGLHMITGHLAHVYLIIVHQTAVNQNINMPDIMSIRTGLVIQKNVNRIQNVTLTHTAMQPAVVSLDIWLRAL